MPVPSGMIPRQLSNYGRNLLEGRNNQPRGVSAALHSPWLWLLTSSARLCALQQQGGRRAFSSLCLMFA